MTTFGIDFGTTNSAIGMAADGKVHLVSPDAADETSHTLPSLLYVTREYKAVVGREAASRYIAENTGRPSHLVKHKVAEVQTVVSGKGSPIIYWHPIYAMMDTLAPGRLLESIKTGLRSPEYEGTDMFGTFYRIEDMIAIFLKHLRERAERECNEPVESAILGRPVKYSQVATVDGRAQVIMTKAAKIAGFKSVGFLPEPVGAGYSYIQTCALPSNICIFDFGGGTLDIAIMHVEDRANPQILSTAGLELGGDDFDKRLMTLLYSYFGQGSTLDGQPFPMGLLGYLQNWREIPNLCLPDNLKYIKRAQLNGSAPQAAKALESLARNHYGFTLYKNIEQAKIRLSEVNKTQIEYTGKDIDIHEPVTRTRLASVIREDLEKISRSIEDAVRASGLAYEQIDQVIGTGGSSQVAPVLDLLSNMFGSDKVRSYDPLTSVVGGIAIYAATHPESACEL